MTRIPLRRRTQVSAAVTVVGIALMVLGALHLEHPAHRAPARAFGAVAATAPVATAPGTVLSPAPTPAAATPVSRVDGAVPLRVRIARLEVDARVVPVVSTGDAIAVPTAPTTLGWWTGGASPGSPVGNTVIVGHVDSATRGLGALFHLDRVRTGDTIDVTGTGGLSEHYRVTALRTVVKTTGLSTRELGSDGPPRLVLITCGGPFDQRTKSYADNIVAFAAPVSP